MDERARLDALADLGLASLSNRSGFDAVTALATAALNCPMSLISIIEEDRQWFLGRTEFACEETSLAISFCFHCVAAEAPLLIGDASVDPRFLENPLVLGEPYIRSYLGVPISNSAGVVIGTVCAMSPERNAFGPQHLGILRQCAILVEQGIYAHGNALRLTRANVSLREFNELFKQAEEAANIGSWRIDLTNNELRWSRQVFAIHGADANSTIDVANAVSFYEPEDRPMVERAIAEARDHGARVAFEASLRRTDGELRRVRALGERIDFDGHGQSIAGVFIDCTEDYLKTAALKHAAERDRLTGLFNRSEFDKRLAAALQEPDTLVTIMLVDLDGFKEVNDALGHLVGDRLLASIADVLQSRAGEDVFVARWGGDEFALLFPAEMTLASVRTFGEELIAAIAEELKVSEGFIQIGATCGVAHLSGAANSQELVRRADIALYHGKSKGRGQVHIWSASLEELSMAGQRMIAQLRKAIAEDGAFAVYQPIVEIETGEVVAVEALLRLRDLNGNVRTANDFITAIIDPLMSRKVCRFMIGQIEQDANTLRALFGSRCKIGINVSEADLRLINGADDLISTLAGLTRGNTIDPPGITLEITETMLLVDDGGQIHASLKALDALGFEIALDDFGTGFSSLTHLRDFPIRKVKIDKEFVSAIDDHQSRMIIQAIVGMSRSLGIEVVAEGIENASQEMFLRAIGCRYGQGYRYGRPATLSDLVTRFGRPDKAQVACEEQDRRCM